MLDPDVCYRALRARDRRFDGRFFTGVRTTGIFCRPICPAPPPRRENMLFYPSAAAAQAAGFRPCLRCRPEAAPHTPAWNGSAATVNRALRLIADGALNEGTVEDLARALGVGDRHLRRLFAKHVGATPRSVAHSERILLAKRLLDDTELPMTRVALAAGFGSIRRFNSVVRDVYDRTPRELRRSRRRFSPQHGIALKLPFRPPFNWQAMLSFFGLRAIAGVEEVTGDAYRRVIATAPGPADPAGRGGAAVLEVRPSPRGDALLASVQLPGCTPLMPLVGKLRHLFDLAADSATIDGVLARDPHLRDVVRRFPGTRVPGAWDRFELGVRAIVGQQVSVRAATTVAGRIAEKFGQPIRVRPPEGSTLGLLFPGPEVLAEADLSSVGMPRARAAAIRGFARAVADGGDELAGLPDAAALIERLTALPGIGPWTARYVAMRSLGDPDVFLESDLGVRHGIARGGSLPRPKEVLRLAEGWRPWRSYAVLYLWQSASG